MNYRGFGSLAIILIIVLAVLAVSGAGYYESQQSGSPLQPPQNLSGGAKSTSPQGTSISSTGTATTSPVPAPGPNFNAIHVGGTYGLLTVASIAPLSTSTAITDTNAVITFNGELGLSGWYSITLVNLFEDVAFNLDQQSAAEIPVLDTANPPQNEAFWFDNQDFALNALTQKFYNNTDPLDYNKEEATGTAIIVVKNVKETFGPGYLGYSFELVSVASR